MTAAPAENPGLVLRPFPFRSAEVRRQQDRDRHRLYRARQRCRQSGGVVLELHLNGAHLHGLRRLGLVAEDERDPAIIAAAVCYLLGSAYQLANLVQHFIPDDERSSCA